MTLATHAGFTTTSSRGLRHDILPMRLYHKAKKLGIWDPRDIDFTQDILDWQQCTDRQKESLLNLTALFQAGEESVTLDLLPLIMVIAQENRIEEELFLTTFLWEEAKHTEFFRRYLDEVANEHGDLHHHHTPSYHKIFYEELPRTMHALLSDQSPTALARASTVYNMIVEGVLAETGYHAYFNMLERNNIMPGLKQGIGYLKRDESRHLAYGVYLLSRLVAQDNNLWNVIEEYMNELLVYAHGMISELFAMNPEDEEVPFGLKIEDYLDFSTMQFSKRVERIQRAKGQSLEQLYQIPEEAEA
ncbi:MAG: R2-like ligand-binding oxidase [Chloroflexota bacterium]|nr:R2-like ligand-binding oxidase [Chloroflexota bacterium]